MRKLMQDLIDFDRLAGQQPSDQPPEIPSVSVIMLRERLISEEFDELFAALGDDDIPGIADGLADLIYVAVGTAVAYGIDLDPIWDAVHAANCAKFGPGYKRDEFGKVLKGPDWKHPDIGAILSDQRSLAEIYGGKAKP